MNQGFEFDVINVKCRRRGCDWRTGPMARFKVENAEKVHHHRVHVLELPEIKDGDG